MNGRRIATALCTISIIAITILAVPAATQEASEPPLIVTVNTDLNGDGQVNLNDLSSALADSRYQALLNACEKLGNQQCQLKLAEEMAGSSEGLSGTPSTIALFTIMLVTASYVAAIIAKELKVRKKHPATKR